MEEKLGVLVSVLHIKRDLLGEEENAGQGWKGVKHDPSHQPFPLLRGREKDGGFLASSTQTLQPCRLLQHGCAVPRPLQLCPANSAVLSLPELGW